ncbi:MAG TPA: hypothetical protein VJU61_06775, partial [Polyangiaceae bacterium]|nr:hypothetical protein [Polyangiaceae bacterium]
LRRLSPLAAPPAAPASARGDSEDGLLPGWTRSLERLTPLQRLLLTRRAGWSCRREALDSVAQRLGLSLERARQVEADAWRQVGSDSAWLGTLRARLERALAAERSVPVPDLLRDDAWWQGVDQHLELAEAVFEALGAELHRVELGPPRGKTAFFARFPQAELDRCVADLLERAAQLEAPAALEDYRALAASAAEALDRGLFESLAAALEAKLELDPSDAGRVLRFATPTGPIVRPLAEPLLVDSEARLRLEDAARWAFRSARTPLSLSAVSERVRQRIDADEDALGALLCHAPFVQRNADQYGLLARDVPGGADAIALALNGVVDALEQSRRVLPLRQAFALQTELGQPTWSIELLRSLVGSDPALCLSTANDITLRRWEHTRSFASAELVCPGLPASGRSRFEKLMHSVPTEPRELAQRLRTELARSERRAASDDFVAVSLARQLCLVHERLLEHAVTQSVEVRALAQAASLYCLAALAQDEDDPEAPAADRAQLEDARAVVAAVLAHLELSWL